jgi:hypothetical protein
VLLDGELAQRKVSGSFPVAEPLLALDSLGKVLGFSRRRCWGADGVALTGTGVRPAAPTPLARATWSGLARDRVETKKFFIKTMRYCSTASV